MCVFPRVYDIAALLAAARSSHSPSFSFVSSFGFLVLFFFVNAVPFFPRVPRNQLRFLSFLCMTPPLFHLMSQRSTSFFLVATFLC